MVGVTSSILVPPTKLIHPAMSFATWAVHEEKKGRPRAAFFLAVPAISLSRRFVAVTGFRPVPFYALG
jgi:hypothetical protein